MKKKYLGDHLGSLVVHVIVRVEDGLALHAHEVDHHIGASHLQKTWAK
jgi:hypothetical protein